MLQQNALLRYIQSDVLHHRNIPISAKELTFRITIDVLGALWGVPWTKPAGNAASIIHHHVPREIFRYVFSAGIVITVGGDGLFVMHQIGCEYGTRSAEVNELMRVSGPLASKTTRIIIPLILSALGCVSSVYASWKYGVGGWLGGIFTGLNLLGSLSMGIYGYSKLLVIGYDAVILCTSPDINLQRLKSIKEALISKTNLMLADSGGLIPSDVVTADAFINYVYNYVPQYQRKMNGIKAFVGPAIQVLCCLFFPLAASTTSVYLTKEFLMTDIWHNAIFSYTIAILMEIPSFVVNMLSTIDVSGRLANIILHPSERDPILKRAYS